MSHSKIDKKQVADVLGLTAMQEGMLFHSLSNPNSLQYFEQIRLRLSGKINFDLMREAWKTVAWNNEMLRSVIRWEKLEEPVQIVLKDKEIPVRSFDLSEEDGVQQEQMLERIVMDDRENPLDISEAPIRVILCRLSSGVSEMIITFHHILYDGWSNAIILGEFQEAYDALLAGRAPERQTKTAYKTFFKWFRSQDKVKRDEFWKEYLQGFDTRTLLPVDRRKLQEIHSLGTQSLRAPQPLVQEMKLCAQQHNVTLSALLYAAWGILLQKYNNNGDVIFGATVSGRPPMVQGIERIVGLFINTLPLRLQSEPIDSVGAVLKALGAHLRDRAEFEHSPLTELRKFCAIGKDSDLFDSLVVIDNYPLDRVSSQGNNLNVESCRLFEMTNFDLTIQVMPFDDMEILFHYNQALFFPETIQRLSEHFLNLLRGMAVNPDRPVSALNMLNPRETEQILNEFNTPDIQYMVNRTIHGVIGDAAAQYPGNEAVCYQDDVITYDEFNRRANKLAHCLRQAGAVEGTRVALMFPRSVEMIVALLAVFKAGAACIPLDISYPDERNNYIIQDSGAGFLLKSHRIHYEHATGAREIIYDAERLNPFPDSDPQSSVNSGDLAYIIYTSGSTGRPKGALLRHSGIVNHTDAKIGVLGITEKDTVGNNFSINVIASVWQILSPLFMGAKLVVYSDEIEWDPYLQFQRVATDGVTVIEVIPSVLKTYLYLVEEGNKKIELPLLRKVALTSEETKPFLVNKFYTLYPHGIDMVDCYGQTENSDDVLHYTIPHDTETTVVPIGSPAINTQVIVLNHHNQLQPVGAVGEICVSGAGVGLGYWNRPELTAEKFVANPLNPGVVMYRTGDLGRWRPDGLVEYLGRIDHQVKIRGNRVELREIENRILTHPDMKEAAVIARDDKNNDTNLFGFFSSHREITISEIRRFLSAILPDYMIPVHFVQMAELPHTPNGKVDRKQLALVEGDISTGAEYRPPRNEFEKKILDIWRQLLDRDTIGVEDHFFDLGGHSLMLIKLKNKLEKEFNKEISIIELFNYPTIGHQARYFSGDAETVAVAPPVKKEYQDKNRDSQGLAIIGISLKIPGASDVGEFWSNIAQGVESITFFSEDELERSEIDRYTQGNNKLVAAGGVIGDIDMFDADFFGFNPREAEIVEPQQRLFLEHAWRAMEDAGYVGENYPAEIGVFAGVGLNTYLLNNVMSHPDVVNALGEFQTMIGNDKDFLSTRTSYKLNLKGPSYTIQCACSTSLAAVHLAGRSILNNECRMALAGGVMIHIPEKTGYFYNEGGYLSPDGHCRAFDAKAQGTVFSNGVGVVVLKRLEDAVSENDHIYAVIKGSGVTNDGSLKVGFTSPSEIGQSNAVIRAMREAGFAPQSVGYVETHGTGTVLGDPVEIAALTRAYRSLGQDLPKQYCAVGSLKSSIGHMDVAAGVIGLIKTALCLKNKFIPPSINVEIPNPIIDFPNTPFYVNTQLKAWESHGAPRRAGVSSFGIGGTNIHMLLEEAPVIHSTTSSRSSHLLMLSARSEPALKNASANLVEYIRKHPEADLADIAYTLNVGRKFFEYNLSAVCRDSADALAVLDSFNKKRLLSHSRRDGEKTVVFMFPGVGEHYVNMAYQLYLEEPVFKRCVDSCCSVLEPLLDKDLRSIMFNPEKKRIYDAQGDDTGTVDLKALVSGDQQPLSPAEMELSKTIHSQTSVFVIEYALARLMMSWGIKPYAMIGYSLGEYVAACLSGVFSLQDALYLVAGRARLIHEVEQGAMLAVNLGEAELKPLLGDSLSLAAKNTPDLCIVSGKPDAVAALEDSLKRKKAVYRRLKAFQAFHSSMMKAVRPDLTELLKKVTMSAPSIPYMSNVTGDWVNAEEVTTPEYWIKHTENPISFSGGISRLLETGCNYFLELGPGNSLCGFTAQHPKNPQVSDRFILSSMPKESEKIADMAFLLRTLGRLAMAGVRVDWNTFHGNEKRKRLALPSYPFERKRYWLAAAPAELKKVSPAADSAAKEGSGIIRKKENIDEWFYIPAWKQTAPLFSHHDGDGGDETRCWVILGDNTPESASLTERLAGLKRRVINVRSGAGFVQNGENSFAMNPSQLEDYKALLEMIRNRGLEIEKIIHLWQMTAEDNYLEYGVYSLMFLVKAMGALFMFSPLELWVISRQQHQIISGEDCDPRQALTMGPCRVISQEYPNIACRNVDIESMIAPGYHVGRVTDNLMAEFLNSPPERVIALRGRDRWVQVYEPLKPPRAGDKPVILREKGVYLITGGLGNVGLSIAHYLAETVRARLVLISRSDFPQPHEWDHSAYPAGSADEIRIRRLKAIQETGGELFILRADVADPRQMADVMKRTVERFGSPNGVLHAAGVMSEDSFALLSDLSIEQCRKHFTPKVDALYVLEEALKPVNPDFCILTSSLSPILGGLSLYAYSAANSFMDAFAQRQVRTLGKNWMSINWADWHRDDMPSDPTKHTVVGATVTALNITPKEGKETFKRALSMSFLHRIVISSGDLRKRQQQWVMNPEDDSSSRESGDVRAVIHKRPDLQSIYEPPATEAEKIIAEIWQELLGLDLVGVYDNFFELGGHSLIATRLISRLREIFRIDVPLPILFDRPTVRELLQSIIESWGDANTVEEIAATYREVQAML